jgi:hypothetical protein
LFYIFQHPNELTTNTTTTTRTTTTSVEDIIEEINHDTITSLHNFMESAQMVKRSNLAPNNQRKLPTPTTTQQEQTSR